MNLQINQVAIRKATEQNLDELYQFEQGVIDAERPFDKTLKKDRINYNDLRAMIKSENVELVMAETDKKIIGSGYARIEKSKNYLQHEYYAYLGFMYVLPEYRGQGVNRKIIAHLTGWAVAKNIKELRLDVYYENVSAIKAYEKIGFSKHMIEMRFNPEG